MQVGVFDDGQLCQFDGCTVRDLLPARCSNCQLVLCSEHILANAHHCRCAPDARLPRCPLCGVVISVPPGESVDNVVSAHIDRGCPQGAAASPPHQTTASGTARPTSSRNPWLISQGQNPPVYKSAPLPPPRTYQQPAATTTAAAAARPSTARPPGQLTTIQTVLDLPPQNTKATALGRPAHSEAQWDGAEVWTPVVHVLLFRDTVAGGNGNDGGAPVLNVAPMYVYARRTHALGKVVDAVVTELQQRGELTTTATRAPGTAAASAGSAAPPRYLYLLATPVPLEATPAMFPPLPLSGLIGKCVPGMAAPVASTPSAPQGGGRRLGGNDQRAGATASNGHASVHNHKEVVVVLSNQPTLPGAVLSYYHRPSRRSSKVNDSQSCLYM